MLQNAIPIEGVQRRPLKPNLDERGCLIECFRADWFTPPHPVQWNIVVNQANILRGVHIHIKHLEYFTVIEGTLLLGLYDLRLHSPTTGLSALLVLEGNQPECVIIPIGVAHGLYFPVRTVFVQGVTRYWNPNGDLGCRWDDPDLHLPWPTTSPILSERDSQAPSLNDLRKTYLAHYYHGE